MYRVMTALGAAAVLALGLLPATARAQEWTVDPVASSIRFETSGYDGPVSGQFASWTADITLDPDELDAASISARVETATGTTDGGSAIDDTLRGEDGLQSAAHPLAEFRSDEIRVTPDGYEAVGSITIRGTSRPFTLPFSLSIADGHAVAEARLTIVRRDFGIGTPAWGSIASEVILLLHIEADAAQ